jgi:hypothetical protein
MPLPPDAILVGAARWLHELRDNNRQHAFEILRTTPAYAGITPTQYAAAFDWLKTTGLLENYAHHQVPEHLVRQMILGAAIQIARPAWLPDADLLIRTSEDLPDDVYAAAAALEVTGPECLSVIGMCRRRIDLESRARLGRAGEVALVRLLERYTDGAVTHVADIADSFGYDIHWADRDHQFAFEVKTTSRKGRLTIYLTRHEYEVSRVDPRWTLIVVHLNETDEITALATVPTPWVHSHVPADTTGESRWESASLSPPTAVLRPGAPTPAGGSGSGLPVQLLVSGTMDGPTAPAWMPFRTAI